MQHRHEAWQKTMRDDLLQLQEQARAVLADPPPALCRADLVVKLRWLQSWMERIGETDLAHCSVAEARLFVTALDVIKGLAGDMAEGLDEEDEGEEE